MSKQLAAREKKHNLSVTFQSIQILLLAYLSWVAAEYLEISGVIALFVCAMVMSHYCWYSIADTTRRFLFQLAGFVSSSALPLFLFVIVLVFIALCWRW